MQNTIDKKAESVTAERSGLLTRVRFAIAGKLAAAAVLVALGLNGGLAGADTVTDPTGGATTTLSSEITGWVTTYGVPMIVAILLVGIIVNILIKYTRKGSKAAG